jgi:hypothetical protein
MGHVNIYTLSSEPDLLWKLSRHTPGVDVAFYRLRRRDILQRDKHPLIAHVPRVQDALHRRLPEYIQQPRVKRPMCVRKHA